jgi:hypothetical protein
MIVVIDANFLMKKFKILSLIPQNIMFHNTTILCHHVEHNIFYLWLKYEAIFTNIVIDVDSFSTNLRTLPNMIPKPYLKTFKEFFLTTKL